MRDSTAGLFLHWGMFTAPRHTDCAAWEREAQKAAHPCGRAQVLHPCHGARPWIRAPRDDDKHGEDGQYDIPQHGVRPNRLGC